MGHPFPQRPSRDVNSAMGDRSLRDRAALHSLLITDDMTVSVTPRRASSVASRFARAASVSRRMRPQRSISQLAVKIAVKLELNGSTNAGILCSLALVCRH